MLQLFQIIRHIFAFLIQLVLKILGLGSSLVVVVEVELLDIIEEVEPGRVKLVDVVVLVNIIKLRTRPESLASQDIVKSFEACICFDIFHVFLRGYFLSYLNQLSDLRGHILEYWIASKRVFLKSDMMLFEDILIDLPTLYFLDLLLQMIKDCLTKKNWLTIWILCAATSLWNKAYASCQ